MKHVYPDFYEKFHCIASSCQHSCCKGWEIDIDEDTAELYSQLPGKLGDDLRKAVCRDETTHFVLTEEENCPFLRRDGLCRLIAELGEEALCDICAEHPRFYNYVSDREEVGLGLCCEEAVRLLLDEKKPLSFVMTEDEEECEADDTIVELRDKIFQILSDCAVPLYERMVRCTETAGCVMPEFVPEELAETMKMLEILDPEWTRYLDALSEYSAADISQIMNGIEYERLAEYFVYRHFTNEESSPSENLLFAFVSTEIICALAHCGYELEECIRMYSSEIEYAEENTQAVKEKCMNSPK